MDAQQELFTELLTQLKGLGYDVYDTFLPDEGASYPFIYLADSQQTDDANKTAVFGNVYQTIHVWHNNPKQRGTVSQMLSSIRAVCYGIKNTANYGWMVQSVDQRILADTTTNTPLLHGLLEVEFRFS